ncbi:MAG: helix-turn-helix transcriptional regulator [Rhizomicrobium sp.]
MNLGHGELFGTVRRARHLSGVALSHRIAAGDVENHTHDDAHFIWVTGGDYVTTAKDAMHEDGPIFIYNPVGTTHRDHFTGGRGSFFSISISAERMRHWQEGARLPDRPVHVRGRSARGLTRKLMQECWDAPDSSLALESLCLELIGAAGEIAERPSPAIPAWLKRAGEILEAQSIEDVSMSELAGSLGVHPVHLTRSFRTHFRCTPGEYLRSLRLQRAAQFLSRTRCGLAEVALMSGFADQSHFTRRFARAFGVTPGEYRKLTIM